MPGPQAGQALVPGMLLALLAGTVLVALYNVGQTAAARARLTHAADAAAYSGALAQARALNLLAYINRAQVAHQVAMAHLVTLASWAQFGQAQSLRGAMRNPPASLISMLFGAAAGQAYAQASSTGGAVPGLARAFQQHDTVVHQVLAHAAAVTLAQLPAMRMHAMHGVLHANYPEYAASASMPVLRLTLLSDGLPGYVRQAASNTPQGLQSLVEHASVRYDFLRPRNITRRNDWMVKRQCPTLRHELRRRGGTWLGHDGRWGATDTLSYHALRSNRWIGCHYREYAMGWGLVGRSGYTLRTDYIDKPPQDFSQQDFWRWVHENTSWNLLGGRSNPLANSYAVAGAVRWPSGGLPAYHDVAATPLPLRFAIGVTHDAGSLPLAGAGGQAPAPSGRYAYRPLGAHETIAVVSAAETYFVRPQSRRDGKSELASLFRPYWQARRSAVAAREQAAGYLP